MKQRISTKFFRIVIFTICIFGLLIIPAAAQKQEKKAESKDLRGKEDVKFRSELFKVVGAKSGFETKVVKDAPYSATVETETIQTFADGNSIKNKNTSLVYRDSEGRTRRESEIPAKGQKIVKEIFISDPANGINYTLDENRKTAFIIHTNLQNFGLEKNKSVKQAALIDVAKQKSPENIDNPVKPKEAPSKNKSADVFEKLSKKDTSITESLGKKLIEGMDCEGKRTTFTIPAGEIGNTLPMNIVSEQWYSPELQVLILTVHKDPRIGETTYRLTNIKRLQPDKSLFEVPANYIVLDKSEFKKAKPAKD